MLFPRPDIPDTTINQEHGKTFFLKFGPTVRWGQHLKEYEVIDSRSFSGACLFERVPCCILKSNGPRSIYTQRSFYLFRFLLWFDSPSQLRYIFFSLFSLSILLLQGISSHYISRRLVLDSISSPPSPPISFFSRSFLFLISFLFAV